MSDAEVVEVREISQARFDALLGSLRNAEHRRLAQEIKWFADQNEIYVGAVLRDPIDSDFGGVVLGQTGSGKFELTDVTASLPEMEEAVAWIIRVIRWNSVNKPSVNPDSVRSVDLLTPLVDASKLHPSFLKLLELDAFYSAREILRHFSSYLRDRDGNLVEQFQTTGFDARLWELYLQLWLIEEDWTMDESANVPDFLISRHGDSLAIEATTVGRRSESPSRYLAVDPPLIQRPNDPAKFHDEYPIRFGSSLYSKLKMKYWERESLRRKPLVFAIADFQADYSMLWSYISLPIYLYGSRLESWELSSDGSMVVSYQEIDEHVVGPKRVPSGFFKQPDCENVSAVLFSNSGTISKFNRMGRQAGFTVPGLHLIRFGDLFRHDPAAEKPEPFVYMVDETTTETWGESIHFYHNPRAKYPLSRDWFPNAAHHYFENGKLVSYIPERHPISSVTHIIFAHNRKR